MQQQVEINIEYLMTNFKSGNDIKNDLDRLILQSTHNEIAEHKEYSRNCCSCRQRMFTFLVNYYKTIL